VIVPGAPQKRPPGPRFRFTEYCAGRFPDFQKQFRQSIPLADQGQIASMPYFAVMIDYGRGGREAVVDPEITRREVVSRIAFERDGQSR
jgi:hypothetical protein